MLDHWPSPNWLQHLLFENPWPGVAVFAAFAMIFAWHAFNRRSRGLTVISVCCLVVAAVIFVLSHTITTTREKLLALDARLVAAVPPADLPTLKNLISPTINFQITRSVTQSQQLDPLLDLIERVKAKYRLHDVVLLDNDARAPVHDPAAAPGAPNDLPESYFKVRVTVTDTGESLFSGSDMPVITEWLCQWQEQPDGSLKIVTLRWLKINNQDPTAALLP